MTPRRTLSRSRTRSLWTRSAALGFAVALGTTSSYCASDHSLPSQIVADILMAASKAQMIAGESFQFNVELHDDKGGVITGPAISWASTQTNVATVSQAGLVQAQAAGTTTISATSGGKTASANLTVLAAVNDVVLTTPKTAFLVGETSQYTATPRDASSNPLTGRTVTWQSSNTSVATVSTAGLVTAVAVGTARISATCEGKTAQVDITVASGGGGGGGGGGGVVPILVEDFSTYTSTSDLHADPRNIYAPEEFGGPWGQWSRIDLDQTTGVADVGAGTSTKSMRYTWPDRTNATGVQPDAPRCADFYIMKQLQLPLMTEIWAEFYVKFSTTFTTKAPAAWSCASNPDYKFIFFVTNPGSRFSLKNDYAGVGNRWDPTAPGQGDGDNNFIYNVWHDGQWHRIRMHSKIAVGGANGAHEVWLDNDKVFTQININTGSQTNIYGINLGNNMNQGPDHIMTLNWGQIKVYSSNPGW